jgi:hypothetical protein
MANLTDSENQDEMDEYIEQQLDEKKKELDEETKGEGAPAMATKRTDMKELEQ